MACILESGPFWHVVHDVSQGVLPCRKQLGPGMLASGILIGLGLWAMLSGAVSMQVLAGTAAPAP